MKINKEYEQSIDLRDLFFYLLYHWRSLLLTALVCAALLGGAKFMMNQRNIRTSTVPSKPTASEADKEQKESYESLVSNYQESTALYERLIKSYEDYRPNSLYMQIDPYHLWVAYATYYVKTPETIAYNDPADAAVYAYTAAVYDGLEDERLQSIFGSLDVRYRTELISVDYDMDANSFTILVRGLSQEMAEQGLEYIERNLNSFSAGNKAQNLPAHQLIKMASYVQEETDTDLESRQIALARAVDTYATALKTTKDNQEKTAAEEESIVKPSPMKSVKKYAAVGFVAGGFLMVCVYVLQYLLEGKMRSAGELSEAYEMPVYGEFFASRARHPGKGIDGLIEKWEFGKSKLNDEAVLDGIIALISGKHAEQTVLLTGTLSEKDMQPLVEKMAKRLNGTAKIDAQYSFLTNKNVVGACSSADAVIVVEKKNESRTTQIGHMAEMLQIAGDKTQGCIVL